MLTDFPQKEEERKAKEEQERREHEEYLLLKESFAVEDEGQEALDEEAQRNLLLEFIGTHYVGNPSQSTILPTQSNSIHSPAKCHVTW